MNFIVNAISAVYKLLWGDLIAIPLPGGGSLGISLLVLLLIPTGVFFTIRTRFLPVRLFPEMLRVTAEKRTNREGDAISGVQALIVSTATRVGMGNLIGVVAAISAGGAGAVFWMWVSALFGMATKFSEVTLGIHYREKKGNGEFSGGAMYYISKGLKSKILGGFFAVMVIVAYFVVGAIVDTNSMCHSIEAQFGIPPLATGIVFSILAGAVILGGISRISNVCQFLTPFMCGLYVAAGLGIIILNIQQVPSAFAEIVRSAFTPAGATGLQERPLW